MGCGLWLGDNNGTWGVTRQELAQNDRYVKVTTMPGVAIIEEVNDVN